jgi:hypothetical protein
MSNTVREVGIVFSVLITKGHLNRGGRSINDVESKGEEVNLSAQNFGNAWGFP